MLRRNTFVCRKEESASRPRSEFVPKTLAELNIEGVSDGYNGGRFTTRSYSISSNSSSSSFRNSQTRNNNQFQNPHHHMYSSQQNLSTATRYTSHNSFENKNNNLNSGSNHSNSNFNRNKVYGSTSNIAIIQKNLGSTGFSVAPSNATSHHTNKYNHNNPSKNVNMTNISVDNWLNAWDNPELQQEQQKLQQQQQAQRQFQAPPPVAAKKPSFDYNSNSKNYQTAATATNYQFRNNNNFNSSKPITLPLKPIQIHNKNVQRTGKINDPWAGDFNFFYFYLILVL